MGYKSINRIRVYLWILSTGHFIHMSTVGRAGWVDRDLSLRDGDVSWQGWLGWPRSQSPRRGCQLAGLAGLTEISVSATGMSVGRAGWVDRDLSLRDGDVSWQGWLGWPRSQSPRRGCQLAGLAGLTEISVSATGMSVGRAGWVDRDLSLRDGDVSWPGWLGWPRSQSPRRGCQLARLARFSTLQPGSRGWNQFQLKLTIRPFSSLDGRILPYLVNVPLQYHTIQLSSNKVTRVDRVTIRSTIE